MGGWTEMATYGCVTDFINDTIDRLWGTLIAALVIWFLIIATQVIQAQRADEPKDDVEQEWALIFSHIKQHAKILATKIASIRHR
jgi:hypothetical protein